MIPRQLRSIFRRFQLPLGVVAFLAVLWLLSPSRSRLASEPGVVEISYLGPSGPISDALGDAVRIFEDESRAAHALDPSKPIYRVVSGQNAMASMSQDPTRFLLSVAGGSPPDVVYFDRFAISEWAARQTFTDLTPFLERDQAAGRADAVRAEDYFAPTWGEVAFPDPRTGKPGIFGVPDAFESRALLYNKDLLRRAGFVDEKGEGRPPRTWKELQEMTVALTKFGPGGHPVRLGFIPNISAEPSYVFLYGWMNGAEFLSNGGRRVTLDHPAMVEAVDYMKSLYNSLGGVKNVLAYQSSFQGGDLDPFLTGDIAMKLDGFWVLQHTLAQYGSRIDYGVAPPPMPAAELAKGRRPVSWIGGWCYAVPATAKRKEAAWELIRFLASPRARLLMAESQRLTALSQGKIYVPSQSAHQAVNEEIFRRYVYEDPSIDANLREAVRTFNDLVPDGRYRPPTPVGQQLFNRGIGAAEKSIYGVLSTEEALGQANAAIQRDLDIALAPPAGAPVNWAPFPWIYLALLLVGAGLVVAWDTSARLRGTVVEAAELVGLGHWTSGSGALDGAGGRFYRWQWGGGFLCALPWILGFVVFTGGPILFSVYISFCDYDILRPATFLGTGNYTRMAKDELLGVAVWNTTFMLVGIPIGMALSLGIAMLLNMKVRGIALWRTCFYLPSIMPLVASSILWIWIFNPQNGLLNAFLGAVGIAGPNWLQDASTSKPALILMGLWGAGGGMIIWLAGLKGIPESYYEAARIDGANAVQQFFSITLPMLSPYIFFNLIMGVIGTLQIFSQAFIITQGGPVNSTTFYVYHLFNHAFRYLNMGYASALALVLMVVVLILTAGQMIISKKWVHYDGE